MWHYILFLPISDSLSLKLYIYNELYKMRYISYSRNIYEYIYYISTNIYILT